ncbi:hypothetical protein [Nitrospirillum sp. BR 11828]|uniref:hypothetical protein n=1 Tax=Nitrospirillum sp. BR 11828 TaxID=3104325 RepID=UPI002ACA5A87|nr:hypothetical protein [Nitrospirillum sp. BR 11828]MDZ5645721.1 hypothetical protein [Nitrospirillum sp. BR 11828]
MTLNSPGLEVRRPSPGYLLNLSLASAGLAGLSVSLGGSLAIIKHADAIAVYGDVTPYVFVFALSIGYLYRLIFYSRVQPAIQNLVRCFLTAIFSIELIGFCAALAAFYLQWSTFPPPDVGDRILVTTFTVFTVVCQIGTVLWLLRYRKE